MAESSMQHDWMPSYLGHGNMLCRRCFATDLEAAVLGMVECSPPPPKAANDDKPGPPSKDEVIAALDMETDDSDPDDGDDMEAECGRWNGGHLTAQCRLAGTEWCDWECPIGCR